MLTVASISISFLPSNHFFLACSHKLRLGLNTQALWILSQIHSEFGIIDISPGPECTTSGLAGEPAEHVFAMDFFPKKKLPGIWSLGFDW